MSTIDKLSISGIRSFGPDTHAKLQFSPPLTLILGQNGCGKTTIIESLKYITTGDMPPGCGKGGSFIHDPKMAKESQVRGQIKLMLQNMKGTTIIATRSVEVTQKAKKLECKTIDTTISRKNVDGTYDNISNKCIDFEYEMISSLGVSKPILNNVIFCHQEDSNWPLDEGKKVKEKFDAIFNATKYIKCLENVRKLRKEMKDRVKHMGEILYELEKWKIEADSKRLALKNQEETLKKLDNKREKFQEDMKPIEKRLSEIRKIENNFLEIRSKLVSKQGKVESLRTAQEELRSGLTEQVKCSDGELMLRLQQFKGDVEEKERELTEVGSNINDVGREMQENQRGIKRAQDRKTDLEFAHSNQQSYIQSRNEKLRNVAQKFSFSEFSGVQEYDDEKAKTVLSMLEDFIQSEQQKIFTEKKTYEKEEASLQSEIDSLRKKEAALEQDIRSKGKQIDDATQKGRQIKQKFQQLEMELASSSLDSIQSELNQVVREITSHEGKLNIQKAKEEIEAAKKSRREVEFKLHDNKLIVNKMNRQAEARSKLDIHIKEKKDLENNIHYLKRKHEDEFEQLFEEIPEENIKNKLDACAQNLRQRSAELRQEKDQLTRRNTQLETSIENNTNQLNKKEGDVKDLEGKIMKICQGEELDAALEKSKKQKEDLARERGDLSSSISVLNRFTEKLKLRDCCPLCHRDFGGKEEVNQLIEELETKVSSVPRKLNQVTGRLEQQEKLYDQMVGLKPQQDQANRTRQEVDKIRAQIANDRKEVEKIKNDLESNTELLNLTNNDEETARLVQNDVVTIENNQRKIKQLVEQIEDLKSTLGGGDGGMTMEEAMKVQSELESESKKYQEQESEMQERLEEHKDKLQTLKDRKLKLSTKELELKTKLQETEKLKEEMVKLEQDKKVLEDELEKAKEEVAPYKYQIDDKTEEKARKTREKDSWIEKENTKVHEIREEYKNGNDLHRCIMDYKKSGKEERLKKSRQELTQLENTAQTLEARKKTLEEQQRQLERDLSRQKERKRNLDDEKKIRDKEEEAKKLQREIADIEDSIKDGDEEAIMREKQQLSHKYNDMFSECAKLDGSSKTIKEEVIKLQADLMKKDYRDAEKNYKEKLVEKKCTDVAADDLNKYYKALDTAIMRFHLDKMHIINEIIRELWRTTYKGNDVDYIEIKTDETGSQGADKRRIYNYRVVMVKNVTEMDMRGRCSAGQKVLASLIIRMALAETFSSNCGILALDEPTTNLDSENIEALAQALLNIVNKRSSQKNFQLIVITHDNDFLQKLAMADYIEHYYIVSRNERGLSMIKRHDARFL